MLGSRIKQPYSMSHQQYMNSKGLFYRGRVFSVKLSAWLRVIKTTCSHRQSSSQEEGKKGPGQESQVYPSKPLIRLCCFFSLRASLSEGWRPARIVSQVKFPPRGRKPSGERVLPSSSRKRIYNIPLCSPQRMFSPQEDI